MQKAKKLDDKYNPKGFSLWFYFLRLVAFHFTMNQGIIITSRIIACLFILLLNSGKIALYNHKGDIHMRIGMYLLSFHN
jgi:hypothetical protein